MKKKLTLMFAILFGLFCLVSCGNSSETPNTPDTPDTPGNGNTDTPGNGNTQQPEEDNYQVKVLYPDGTPATSSTKIKVQVCTTEGCQFPIAIDDSGVALLEDLADDTYFVHLQNVPAGYTYNPNLTIKPEAKQLDLKLIQILTPASGEGTQASPYVMTEGAYSVTCSKAREFTFFTFTPTEAGTYMIESLIQTIQSGTVLVPALHDVDNNKSSAFADNTNFAHTLVAEANKTYTFAFTLMDNTVFPTGESVSYNFTVSKSA